MYRPEVSRSAQSRSHTMAYTYRTRAQIPQLRARQSTNSALRQESNRRGQANIPCELTRHDHCVHDCLPRREIERELVNSISDVETGLELFHGESTIDLPRTGKIRWQNVCSNNCSFALEEKSDGDDMVRHKVRSSRSTMKNQGICWSNDSFRKLTACGVTGNACACTAAIASTVLHGNNAVN